MIDALRIVEVRYKRISGRALTIVRFILCIILLCTLSIPEVNAQPEIEWSATFGGNNDDVARQMVELDNGCFVIAGNRNYFQESHKDFYLVKTDSVGEEIWSTNYEYAGNEDCRSLAITNDGGFLLSGSSGSLEDGNVDGYVIKADSTGEMEWDELYGGDSYDAFFSIIYHANDEYLLAGETASEGNGGIDIWLLKINDEGDIEWSETYGGDNNEVCFDIMQTSNGDYLLLGATRSFGNGVYDAYVVRVDSDGEELWSEHYGYDADEGCNSAIELSSGNLILSGYRTQNRITDILLIKIDEDGEEIWHELVGGEDNDFPSTLLNPDSGRLVLSGTTASIGAGSYDFFLMELDTAANIHWWQAYGGRRREGGGYLIQTHDLGYALCGDSYSWGEGLNDFWVVKTEPDIQSSVYQAIVTIPNILLLHTYPNPFNSSTTFSFNLKRSAEATVNILNTAGRRVDSIRAGKLQAGENSLSWQANDLPNGVYLAQISLHYEHGVSNNVVKLLLLR